MLTSVISIALISHLPAILCSKHPCVPNTQFDVNEKLCFCDSEGWWDISQCREINRGTCTVGEIIRQGCNECICQENGQLLCSNTACYDDVTLGSGLIVSTINSLDGGDSINSWCTPYKSYYINCSICVCSASGRTADSHCATDNSCQKQPPSTTDFLASVNKNICIPKVMYLFSCIHCLCSDGGYFILDQCVETCHRPQQTEPRRCISRTFYRKKCNICWCPENGVADDKYCTTATCSNAHKFTSLQSLKAVRRKCQVNTFQRPKCYYCSCDPNGNVNENACLESDCLKSNYLKYDILKNNCSPGEMVPICQECFCLKGGMTNQSYCSKVCSYPSKLNVLEKVLKDNQDNNDLIDNEKIQRINQNENCEPNSMYLDQGQYCLCPENGSTHFKLCTSIIENYFSRIPISALSSDSVNAVLNVSCEPNTFVEIGCNTCYCDKNGTIDHKWCTNDNCEAKNIIQYGQNKSRSSNLHSFKANEFCKPGSIAKVDCNFCICPQSGVVKERACTKNECSDIKDVYDENFACDPLEYYLVDCNVCLCPQDGVKNVEKCTKKICVKPVLRSDSCTPGQFFSHECNVCICPPNGNKSDRVCTRHKCPESEASWRVIFRLSQSFLHNKPIEETPAPKQDLDLCFSGEEFEIGCTICVCPDVGLKSHATCLEVKCEKEYSQDHNRPVGISKDLSKEDRGKTALVRFKRHHSFYSTKRPVHYKMVFNYKRKSERASWSEISLERAVNSVKEEGKSINFAAKKFGIPFTTLYRHIKSGSVTKKLGRFVPVFTPEQEEDLCTYLKKLDSLFFGLTRSEFLALVFEYATKNNIAHPFKNGKAGDDWFAGFKNRHPEIVLRAPEPTSVARTRGFNRPQVELFYKNYLLLLEKHKFDATTIYNMDETGIKSTTSKPPKVLSVKGKRQVGVVSSAERGQLTTVICCCNAAGTYVSPFFIFARKRMQERLLDGAPPGSQATVSDNGWVNGEAFLNWLQFFADTVRPNENRKVLLLLDNHESHKYYPALEFASKNNIIFLSFAPHTTDRMQPLDVAVYGPLKKYFEQELNTFQKAHPGRIVNQYDMAKLFGGAYVKSASVLNAVNGFKKPGIWPYDPNIFGEEDYAPSTMTDRPLNEAQRSFNDATTTMTESKNNSASSSVTPCLTDTMPTQAEHEDLVTDHSANKNALEQGPTTTPIPESTLEQGSPMTPIPESTLEQGPPITPIPESTQEQGPPMTPIPESTLEQGPPITPIPESTLEQGPPMTPIPESTLEQGPPTTPIPDPLLEQGLSEAPAANLTPFQIRPIPTMAAPKTNRKNKRQRSEILTSTPVKVEQAAKYEKANKKKSKIAELASSSKAKINKKKTCTKTKRQNSKQDFFCLVCAEKYTEPPSEDWIQCSQCKNWAHDNCTSYTGVGSYFCDECQD